HRRCRLGAMRARLGRVRVALSRLRLAPAGPRNGRQGGGQGEGDEGRGPTGHDGRSYYGGSGGGARSAACGWRDGSRGKSPAVSLQNARELPARARRPKKTGAVLRRRCLLGCVQQSQTPVQGCVFWGGGSS